MEIVLNAQMIIGRSTIEFDTFSFENNVRNNELKLFFVNLIENSAGGSLFLLSIWIYLKEKTAETDERGVDKRPKNIRMSDDGKP